MMNRNLLVASGLLALLVARSATGQNIINAGTYPAGNYQWRIDTDPGTAGYQIARRVTGAAGATFNIDIKMANIPASPTARYLFFRIYWDPALISFTGSPLCLPGVVPAPDDCFVAQGGPNWVQIGTLMHSCVGWSGEVTVARLTFSIAGATGVTGLDVKDAMSAKGDPACGQAIGDTSAVAKAVIVVDPNGANNLSSLTVNTTGNAATCNLTVRNPDTECTDATLGLAAVTLRSALQIANAAPGNNRITFFIPGAATITNPMMPQLTDAGGVHVDGTTQPGTGVEVKGPAAATMGFDIVSANNIIEDLTINNFTGAANAGVGINGSNNTVRGCRIGTNTIVTLPVPNGNGVIVTAGTGNLIGIPGNGNSISGNTNDGVVLSGGTGTVVRANCIGTNGACTAALANLGRGIFINGAASNTIGGTANGSINIISGNSKDGIEIVGATASNNQVNGNYIGTDLLGNAMIPNGFAGVCINGAPNNTIGAAGALGRNVISGNAFEGVEIIGVAATGNVLKNNYIGTNAAGIAAIANLVGVLIDAAPNNTIGGANADERNVISGNEIYGVELSEASGTLVRNNYIGTNAAGTLEIGNVQVGVQIDAATNNTIGGATPGERNVISGNEGTGVRIGGTGSSGNIVRNNFIGLNAAGTGVLPNLRGVLIFLGAHDNVIGGVPGNHISGNLGSGISIAGAGADGNLVQSNTIGLNGSGTAGLGNVSAGVIIEGGAEFNQIGGVLASHRNVIAGNGLHGVWIDGSAHNEVRNNTIGQSAVGTDFPNSGNGVNLVAGAFDTTVVANSIYANLGSGVFIAGAGTDQNEILQNFIGAATHGNASDGVDVGGGAQNNVISVNNIANNGTPGNLASGNGIHLDAAGTSGNLITANQLLGNLGPGVFISGGANINVIGGDIPAAANIIDGNLQSGVEVELGFDNSIRGNIIRFNNVSGVWVIAGTGNQVSRNSIFSNNTVLGVGGLGIDLTAAGVSPNDAGDGDAGGNATQNFPVLTSVIGGTITGTLNSTPNHAFSIEFFSNTTCDASGNGEGETFLGAQTVNTDNQGAVAFNFAAQPAAGTFITATATDVTPMPLPLNNTSEFSPCVQAQVGPPPCLADLAPPPNGNGFVNVDDLLAVINAWGPCASPCPPHCPADIAPPPNGNCFVNVDDLLAVINAWGPCP